MNQITPMNPKNDLLIVDESGKERDLTFIVYYMPNTGPAF